MNPRTRFPGWSVAWTAFIIAFFAWGIGFYGPGVILQTLHQTAGWSIATISAAVTLHFVIGACIVAFLPELHDAFGIVRITIAGALLTAGGLVAWSMASVSWHLVPAAVISGSGWAMTSGAALNAMISPWFDRDRSKAINLAFNGASIGGVVFTPLFVVLIARVGFPASAVCLGGVMVLIVSLLAQRYLGRSPNDLGLMPDGRPLETAQMTPATAQRLPRAELMRTREFATLSAAFALALFAQVGVLSHLLARLSPVFGTGRAAAIMSFTTISAVVGRTLLGWLLGDRDRRGAASINFLVQSIGVGLLCFADTHLVLLIGCTLFGLGVGNVAPLPTLIAQKEFRGPNVGTVVALVVAINQAVFAFAPAVLGMIRDVTADYTPAFIAAAVAQVLAALIVLAGRRGQT